MCRSAILSDSRPLVSMITMRSILLCLMAMSTFSVLAGKDSRSSEQGDSRLFQLAQSLQSELPATSEESMWTGKYTVDVRQLSPGTNVEPAQKKTDWLELAAQNAFLEQRLFEASVTFEGSAGEGGAASSATQIPDSCAFGAFCGPSLGESNCEVTNGGTWCGGANTCVAGACAASDTTAPTFDSAPASSSITTTSFNIDFSLNEQGTAFAVAVPDGETAPSAAQVFAGQKNDGSAAASNSGASNSAASGTTPFTSAISLTGLAAGTTYDVYVVAQDDEGTPNQQTSVTAVANVSTSKDNNSTVGAGGGTEASTLATTIDTVGEEVDLFDFAIADVGTSDGLPTVVTELTVAVSGTSIDSERGLVFWTLDGPDASSVTGSYAAGTDLITFSSLTISVANGGSETYSVRGYFNDNSSNNDLVDGSTYILTIADTNITTGSGSSGFATSSTNSGSGFSTDVTATQIAFTQQPSGSVSGVNLTTQPVVTARDARGNTDTNFTETITLTENSSGTVTGGSVAASSGVATFTSVNYTASADQESFTLTADDQTGVGTDLGSVDASSVTSDVVATGLVFDTQPAPTSITSGVSTDFSTDPVLLAVDDDGTLDTGFTGNVTLSVVDTGDSSLTGGHTVNSFSSTADSDSGGEVDVTQSASGGTTTFTGLTLQYTVSGASDVIDLRATSSITAANSTAITATANNVPVVELGGSGNNDTTASFTEVTGAVAIASAATVSDGDNNSIQSITITATNIQDTGSEGLSVTAAAQNALGGVSGKTDVTRQSSITLNNGSDSLSASVAEVQTFLRAVTFDNVADAPTSSPDRTITVVINDGTDNSISRTSTVSVAAVTAAETTGSDFNTTSGSNLNPGLIFDASNEILTIANSTHITSSSNAVANGGDGTDTVVISAGVSADLTTSGFTLSNFENLTLNDGASATMVESVHDAFAAGTITAGAGTETITLGTSDGDDTVTGNADIEQYNLNDAYTFTLGATSQDVTGNAGASQTVNIGTFTLTSASDLEGGTGQSDVLQMATGSSIASANSIAGFETLEVTGSVTMTESQHDGFTSGITAAGASDQITVSSADANASIIADGDIETYILGAAMTVAANTAAQNVTGSSGADTLSLGGSVTYTGTLNGNGATDVLSLANGANIAGATVSNFEDITLADNASVSMTGSQVALFNSGTTTAGATETINVSGDGDFTTLANVESWSVADDSTNTRTINLGADASSITADSANDAVTFNIGTVTYTGNLTGNSTDDTVQLGNGSSIASASLANVSGLTVDSGASVTMTEAQHDSFTSVTATGTNQITLSAASDGFSANADVEIYVLGAANSVTLGTSGGSLTQTITGSSGNDTVTTGAATYTGTLNGNGGTGDTLSLPSGANVSGATVTNFENMTLSSGASSSLAASQLAQFTGTITAPGTETLSITGDGDFTVLTSVETYVVGDDSTNTRTVSIPSAAAGVVIQATSVSDAVTYSVPGITFTGSLTGNLLNDTVQLASGANISGGTLVEIEQLSLGTNASITMSAAQYESMLTITAAGAETINIVNDGDLSINATSVETYIIEDDSTDTRSVTLGSNNGNTFSATSSTDAITFDISTFDFTGSVTGNTAVANTFVSDGSNDIVSATTISGFANLTLDGATNDLTLTAAQLNAFSGTVTADGGSDTLTLSATGSVTGGNLSAIETFSTGTGGGITITIPATDAHSKTLTATTSASDSFTVTAASGSQTINGSAGGDNLSGGDDADVINGNDGGDTINGGAGADTISPGAGTDSMTGSDGNDIFSGSSSDLNGDTIADLSTGDTVKITGVTGLTTSNVRFNGSNTLQVDTDATDFAAVEVAMTLSDGAGGNLNVLAVADNGSDTDITFEDSNNAPVFANLDGAPAFTEGGSAQVLDANVTISDTELDALNASAGNYSGATLTISRNGGANANDVFTESGSLSAMSQAGSLTFGGNVYGTVTTNSNGTLLLTFSDAATVPTTAIVSSILQAITYSNSADAPSASVVLNWVFNDGTTNSTGTNQATVSVTAINDAPVLSAAASPTLTAIDEDAGDDDGSAADGDDDATSNSNNGGTTVATMVTDASITDADGSAVEAIAVITVDNSNGLWQYSTDNGTSWVDFSGVTGSSVDLSATSRLLDGTLTTTNTHKIRFVPNSNYNGTSTITYRAWDKTSGSAGATADTTTNGDATAFSSVSDSASITVNSINDTPSVSTNTGVTVERGSNLTIANTALTTSDTEDSAGNITYTVTTLPTNGALQLSSSSLSVNGTFTQNDIDNSNVRYVHAGGVNTSDSFTFTVADSNAAQVTGQTFNITVQDTTAPGITGVSITNSSHKVGDTVTATITVSSDSDTYTLGASTVAGYTLSNLSKTNDTTYTATFSVAHGGTDVAAGSDVPVSIVLTDSSSNSNSAFTTAISQSGDAIYANVPNVTLSADTTTIAEDGGVATLTATLSGSLNNQWPQDVGMSLVYSGTATNTTDYTRSGTSITISAGSSSNTVTVTSVADTFFDALSDETVIVDIDCFITGSATEATEQRQTITITDAESAPTVRLSVDNSAIAENGGTSTPTVTLSNATFEAVSVTLAYSGTATAAASGADYNNTASTTITVSQGSTTNNASTIITSVDDSASEGAETIIIDVDGVSGGGATEATTQQQTVSITDDDNTAPAFNNLDGTPTYTENGTAVALDSNVTVVDAESDANNSSQGNYTGATLTITRSGGANSEDTMSVSSGNQMAVSGADITNIGGDKFASFASSTGTLTVTFSGDLTIPTTALVAEVLQNITYSNSSDNPATSITLVWSFSDGSLSTSGTNQTVVSITPVNDAPVIGTNTGITTSEGGTEVVNNTELNESDPDDGATGLTYTVTTLPSDGTLQLSSTDINTNDTFTQDDIDNARVQYVHGGGEATSDSFIVSLADGGEDSVSPATATVNVTISGLNDSPTIATNATLTVNQGGSGTITNSFLNEGDPDDSGTGLTYTVTTVPANGAMTNNGTAISANGTFTQDDIDNSRVVYTHAGGDNTTDSFAFNLADGGENSASAASGTFSFSINDNISPTLASSTPADNATSISVSSNLVLTFSENIQFGSSGSITLINATTGANIETFDVSTGTGSNSGTVSVSGTDVTINPGADLSAGSSVAVQVASTAITDDSSNTNAFAGIADNTTLNFTTQPKVLIAVSPATILEPGTETATFTVTLQDSSGTSFTATDSVTVGIELTGTATVATDYTPSVCGTGSCGVTIASGQSNTTFTAQAINDGSGDAGETIIASITSITTSNATEDGDQSATVTITENTAPTVSNLPSALTVTEDTTNNVDISATTFADGEGNSLTVTLTVSSGTISSPLGSSGSVTVTNASATSMTLAGSTANLNSFVDNSNALAITPEENSTSDITLTMTPNDGALSGSAVTSTVSVTAVNDAPTVSAGTPVTIDMTGGSGTSTNTFTDVNSDITFTALLDSGTWSSADFSNSFSTEGDVILSSAGTVNLMTLSFSPAVDIDSFVFLNNLNSATDFTFTVTAGSGTTAIVNKSSFTSSEVNNTVDVTDWTSVTEVQLTNASTSMWPIIDSFVVTQSVSDLSYVEDVTGNTDLSSYNLADVDSASITLTLSVNSGSFSAPADGSGVGSGVTATLLSSTQITLAGSVTDINTYLDTASNIQYTGAQNSNGNNVAQLTISANDGDGSGDVTLSTVNIDITAVNDAPAISGTPDTTVAEDSSYTFTPTATDAENETITFSITNQPSWAAFDTATGALTGTPTNVNVGTTSNIVITASDGTNSSNLTAFAIEVTNVNDAPTITSGASFNISEDSGANNLTITAADVDSTSLTWSITTQPSSGVASISGSGTSATLSYTPNTNANGTDTLQVSVSDGSLSDSQTLSISVAAVNDAPTISGSPATTVNEDTAYSFTPTAADVDGDTVTFSIANQPSWATFSSSTGALTGTPGNGNVGTTSNIVISVSDGTDSNSLAAFSIEVINVNDAPVITSGASFNISEDSGANNLTLTASDVDNASLTWSVTTQPVSGTASISGSGTSATLSYTPNTNANGTDTLQVSVSDGSLSDSQTLSISVAAVNDAPTISGSPATTVNEDTAYSFTPTAADVDGDTVTFSIANQPSWATFSSSTGALTGTPGNGNVGTTSNIVISVSDGTDSNSLAAFSIEVINVNDAPVITSGASFNISEDSGANNLTLTASDVDNASLTWSVTTQPVSGTASISGTGATAILSYTPNANANGSDTLQVSVSDGSLSASQTLSITVAAVNDAPTISGSPATTVNEDTTYSFTPTAADVDGDTLTFSIANQPSWAGFDSSTGSLSGTPDNAAVGTTSNIVISVSDGNESAALAAFSIEVINVNDAPAINNSGLTLTLDEDSDTATTNVTATDVDSTSLTWAIVNQGSLGVASINNGSGNSAVVTYVPNANVNGADTLSIRVSDGEAANDATIAVTIAPVNDAPTIAGTAATLVEVDTAYLFTPTATDIDGDSLTFSIDNQPGWASFDSTDGTLSGTPVTNDVGTTTGIVISVTDGTLSASLVAFDLEVIDPNMNFAPTVEDIVTETAEDTPLDVTLLGTDPNDDTLTYSVATQPANGAVTVSGNVATYTPSADFNGSDSFTYLASDSLLESDAATVTLTVTAVNDAPVIEGTPSTQTAIDVQYSFVPSATDIDSDTLTFSIQNQPDWATFDTTTGTLAGTPVETNIGDYLDIVISVSDGDLSTNLESFSIAVINPNQNTAPVATDIATQTAEDTPLTVTLTATDADGDTLSYSVLTEPQFGTITLVDAQLTYTPLENLFDETEVLEYVANDGVDASNTATLSILITPVNDAPVIEGEAAVSVRVGQEYRFIPGASDVEQDTLTFSIQNQPRWANFDGNTGELSGVPGASDVGTYGNVTIRVSDGAATTSITAFNIEVLANEAPVISGTSVTAVETGTSYQFAPQASDAEGDTLTFSIVNQPAWTQFDTATGTLTGAPTSNDVGNYPGIVISVSDGFDIASLPAFDVEVCDVCANVAPTIIGAPATTVVEGSFYTFAPVAVDSNNDVLTFSIVNQPSWAAFEPQTGVLTGTPTAANVGATTGVVISVTDGEFTASLPPFTITVEEFNDAPVIAGVPDTTVFRDTQYRFTPTATDAQGDTLTFSIENKPSWAAFNSRTGTLRGTPDSTEVGNYLNIMISVTDGVNTASLDAFAIEVLARNSAPVISGTPRTGITQGNAYSFTPQASDADGDALTFSATGLPAWLAMDATSGVLSGTPQNADIGTSGDIILSVSDGQDTASLAAFTIEVTSGNSAPVATDSSVTVAEDNSVTINASVTDADGDTLTLTLVNGAANGALSDTATGWVYTPNSQFAGTDTFVYQANDGSATSGNATVTITVTAVNDLPIAQNDTFTVDQNDTGIYTLNVVNNDTDVDINTTGDNLTVQGADANFGVVNIVNNQLEFNPGASFIGNVTLVYAIRDDAGASDQADVALTINGVAGVGVPVVATPADVTVDATGLFTTVDLGVAGATDADGNPLPVRLVDSTTTFAPGTHTVFWQAEDSFGTVTTESQTVNVNPLISLSKDQVVSEGSQVTVNVILNGDAPVYPLTVDYTVSGSATADGIDHDAQSGSVTFAEGRSQTIAFDVFVDGEIESQESVVFTLNDGQNLGANNVSTITLSEANIAPEITLTVRQGGDNRLTVAQDEGNVRITGSVSDANPQDSLAVEWSSIGLSDLSNSDNNFIFRPADVATGIYQVTLFASDDGNPILSNTADVFVEVVATLDVLSSTADSDGDLIPDAQEGYGDADGDGIPDYLDSIDDCNVVPEQATTQNEFLVESEPGVCLRQGSISALNSSDGIEVLTDVQNGTAGRQARNSEGELVNLVAEALPQDTEASNIGGIFDFILYDLPEEGQIGAIVLPQRQPIPANALYRKFKTSQEIWVDFIIDDNNQIFSAEGERGICPPPGSASWVPGLSEGHWCVQLQILDGGANDDDGTVNGAIADPGGVAVVLDNNALPVAADDAVTMQWNTSVDIAVLANDTDADGDNLTVSNVVGDFGESTIAVDGIVTYTPDAGFVGEDVLVYAITDGNGGTSSAQVTVTIDGNRAPGAVADSANTDDDTAIEIDVLANDIDIDGDQLNIVSATAESGEVTITDTNTLIYTPEPGFDGLDTITYVVADTFGETATATVSVVVDGNQAPQALDDTATTAFNTAVTVNVLSNDMDVNGDTLTVTSATASDGTVSINDDSSLTYTPTSGFSGTVTIQYSISDGLLEANAVLTVTVQPQPVETITVTNKSSGGGGSLAYLIWLLLISVVLRQLAMHNRKIG